MTLDECAARIRANASARGMTPAEYADWFFNRRTPEEIATAMESLPTDVLEWAERFEALAHKGPMPDA
jgi:hypothetical protein